MFGEEPLPEPPRRAPKITLFLLPAAHLLLALIINLGLFAGNTFRPQASAGAALLANLVFLGVLLVILRFGRLRPRDVGLIPRQIPQALVFALGIWAAAQAIQAAAGLAEHGTLSLRPEWKSPGVMLGILFTQVVGNALFEETAYRGFVFRQLRLRTTLPLALLVSQGLFALSHLPNRIYLGMTPAEMLIDLLMLLGWGTFYVLVYLRTGSLFVGMALHALGNAPTSLFTTSMLLSGDGASILIYTLVIVYLFGLPLLRNLRSRRPRLQQAAPA